MPFAGGLLFTRLLLLFVAAYSINQVSSLSERCMGLHPNDPAANVRALRGLLQNYLNVDMKNRFQRHVNIVLIGHGSYSDPAFEYRGHHNLREVVLYEPYGTAVNDAVVLGISTGDIHPDERRFDGQFKPPRDWNRIPSNRRIKVPSVWLSPLESNHLGFRRFENCLHTARQSSDRILIAYTGGGPPQNLWSLATDIAEAARLLRVQITVHWAACLSHHRPLGERYFGTINKVCKDQYAFYRGVMGLNYEIMTNPDFVDESFWAPIRPFFAGN